LFGGVSLGGCGDFALVLQGLLGGPLPAGGQQQCNGATGGDSDSASGAYRVQLHAGIGVVIEAPEHSPRCHGDPEHEHGPQHDRPSRQGSRWLVFPPLPSTDHDLYIGRESPNIRAVIDRAAFAGHHPVSSPRRPRSNHPTREPGPEATIGGAGAAAGPGFGVGNGRASLE